MEIQAASKVAVNGIFCCRLDIPAVWSFVITVSHDICTYQQKQIHLTVLGIKPVAVLTIAAPDPDLDPERAARQPTKRP